MKLEEAMTKLNKIVAEVENEATDLDQSIQLYSEGVRLAQTCLEELQNAKGRVKVLQQDVNKLIESNFNIDTEE